MCHLAINKKFLNVSFYVAISFSVFTFCCHFSFLVMNFPSTFFSLLLPTILSCFLYLNMSKSSFSFPQVLNCIVSLRTITIYSSFSPTFIFHCSFSIYLSPCLHSHELEGWDVGGGEHVDLIVEPGPHGGLPVRQVPSGGYIHTYCHHKNTAINCMWKVPCIYEMSQSHSCTERNFPSSFYLGLKQICGNHNK